MVHSTTPPMSPIVDPRPRPKSAMMRPMSRTNIGAKTSSRNSDEDAKTTVQVAVRVRPPLSPTDPGFDLIPQRFQKSMVHVTSPTNLAIDAPAGRKLFVFDRVFGEEVHQDGIWDYISTSVDSFLQGYNVSVMAYGQSGAGKSFTMGTSGPQEQNDRNLMGIIPRAANALFSKLAPSQKQSGLRNPNRYSMSTIAALTPQKQPEKSWQLKATYVEIYNEQLRDLLLAEATPAHERQNVTIREDTKGRIILTGLHQVNIDSAEDLMEALNLGSTIRQTDATAINARSSRSHAVFSLHLVRQRPKVEMMTAKDKRMSMPAEAFTETVTIDSKLHFVDLAGSERLKNTQAIGDRAKEGISINAGLASLGKVISQLSSRNPGAHVSYRDSKLTRLLQDSLGGNAVTYLIACVTPAEFHLSETLNTVQYAQRARAIQTKPQIQQVDNGSDKQAVIDRLRAEIQFLRDQIRSAENGGGGASRDRQIRSDERETELQNRLIDLEDNYAMLSQRHAKLMSEMTKKREQNGEDMALPNGTTNDNAIERIKRSASFADAVEQVVLEYEKTIQSLESSLSKTRSTLSTNESALLEKETHVAYIETMNQQLQSRIQKMIDRETNNEKYIHDMESRLDGVVGGEERQSAMVLELRKEINRLRDSETNSEEYIAGLEDKLAEAVNNSDNLHRDISRLEDALERQRNVGKMDNLLSALDHGEPKTNGVHPLANGHIAPGREVKQLTEAEALREATNTPIPEDDDEVDLSETSTVSTAILTKPLPQVSKASDQAQSTFLQEKLEMVNQELFDLRVEHESTVSNYELLSAKYAEALRTLARLHESIEDSQEQAPSPFLVDEGANNGQRDGGKHFSSRSLSLELSSLGQSTEATEPTEIGSIPHGPSRQNSDVTSKEIEKADDVDQERLLSRHSAEYSALQQRYEALNEQHLDVLDLVEELKTEVSKAKHVQQQQSITSKNNNLIRRKSRQDLLNIDRAHRSLASLENIASDNFADNPDLRDSFNIAVTTITHELHQRTERVQELESDLVNTKKELDTKMTIISGLARERTSMVAAQSPVELSMLGAMQDQIVELERQLQSFHINSGAREEELLDQISSLRKSLDDQTSATKSIANVPGALPESPTGGTKGLLTHDSKRIPELEAQIAHWQDKHQVVVESMQASEKRLLGTISELESVLAAVEQKHKTKVLELESSINSTAAAAAAFDLEREKHGQVVAELKNQIQARAITIGTQASRLVSMEKDLMRALTAVQEHQQAGEVTVKTLDDHRAHIENLEKQLAEHQATIGNHKDELAQLQDNHESEMRQRSVESKAETRMSDLVAQHTEVTSQLQQKIEQLETALRDKDREAQEHKRAASEGSEVIESLRRENKTHSRTASEANDELKEARTKLKYAEEARERAEANFNSAQSRLEELQWAKQELKTELQEVREREQRASRLVEELEGQLNSTYEDSRNTTSRLSHLQTVRDKELLEARTALVKAQEESYTLRNRVDLLERGPVSPLDTPNPDRANSLSGQIRKASITGALPASMLPSSPPPTQPLPPIPTSPGHFSEKSIFAQQMAEAQQLVDRDNRIRTMEKHLKAEKQLTQTLEEALSDLEGQVNKSKKELEAWKQKAWQYEDELGNLRRERQANRQSLQQIEEAKTKQREAEVARQHLEERMAQLNKKKKKGGLNCF